MVHTLISLILICNKKLSNKDFIVKQVDLKLFEKKDKGDSNTRCT